MTVKGKLCFQAALLLNKKQNIKVGLQGIDAKAKCVTFLAVCVVSM